MRLAFSLLICLLVAGCIQIKTPPLPEFTPETPLDLRFSNAEAFTSGEVAVNITKGSTTVPVGRLSWGIIYNVTSNGKNYTFTYLLTNDSIFSVNSNPSTLNTPITGGDRIIIKTGNKWDEGQNVRLKIIEKATGRILDDIKLNVKPKPS